MQRPVFIGRSYYDGPLLLLAFIAGVAALTAINLNDGGMKTVVGLFGVLMAAFAVARLRWIGADRRWFTPGVDSFHLGPRGAEREFPEDAVSDIAAADRVTYFNGKPDGVVKTCTLTIRAGDAAADLRFRYKVKAGSADPLAAFYERVLRRLTADARASLEAGAGLVGHGWGLSPRGLAVEMHGGGVTIPTADLADARLAAGKLSVWRAGEPRPVAVLDSGGPNVLVLACVLGELLSGRPRGADDFGELGRVLAERDKTTSKIATGLGVVVMVPVTLAGVVGVASGFMSGLGIGAIMLALIGPPLYFLWRYLLFRRRKVLRVHERAAVQEYGPHVVTIPFDEAEGFTFTAVRSHYHGAYVGTSLTLRLRSRDGRRRIRHAESFHNEAPELDAARDVIAAGVATALLQRLRAGESVEWVPGLTFKREGLHDTRRRWFRRADDLYTYGSLSGVGFKNGYCTVFVGATRNVPPIPAGAENFFPGLFLLQAITGLAG